MLIERHVMIVIQINPYEKNIKLAKFESFEKDNNLNILEENAQQIEKDLKIASYPIQDKGNRFFYYVKETGNEGQIYTFNGIGIVFGNIEEKTIEKIKKNIVW